MKVAFFNWRDIRHPLAGGAELYIHEVMKRLAAKGHSPALFCSTFPGCRRLETVDGVPHVRYAGRFSMYASAFLCYRQHVAGRYDAIVESINGMPFFTAMFAREPVVSLIHQLTRENWYSGLPLPLAFAGYHSEDALLLPYRGRPAIVPSESTSADLRKLGFGSVSVVHGGCGLRRAPVGKERTPTMLCLGRLAKSKRVDHAMRAFRSVRDSLGGAKLWLAGSGPEEGRLRSLAASLGMAGDVEFFGKVGEERKAELLSRAHLLLFPAVREGWGLVVTEANACGTPAIGYDVHGLRDSIRDGVNGVLVPDGRVDEMAAAAAGLLRDRGRLKMLSESSAEYAGRFTWDRTAEGVLSVLAEAVG